MTLNFGKTVIPLMRVQALNTGYGDREVLNNVSIELRTGETVAIIGHNGAGKSTLLKTIFGLIPIWSGHVEVDGGVILNVTPIQMLKRGICYLPQGNRIYGSLSVRENLLMGGITLSTRVEVSLGIERVMEMFPALKPLFKQQAGTLSGGEQQMLSLACTFMLNPRILLLDEPSLGLFSKYVFKILNTIKMITREAGVSVLIVEQKVREVLHIADRVYVMRLGQVSFTGLASELMNLAKLKDVYL